MLQIPVLQIFELLFVGRHALEPAERRDHREQQMQFGVLRHGRLDEQRGFRRVEARGQPVGGDLQRVFRD